MAAWFKGITRNLRDAIRLGPTFPLRHVSGALGREYHVSAIKDAGVVRFRPNSSDAQTITDIFADKVYDLSHWPRFPEITKRYRAILDAGQTPVIVDAGANIGAASIWFARRYPDARVIAVEPDYDNAELCRINTAGLPNVTVIEAAIGATNGQVSLSNPDGQAWTVRTTRDEAGGVAVLTVADLLRGVPGEPALFIVKVDIEGFEDDLFSTGTDWLEAVEVMIIEPHDWMLPGKGTSRNLQVAVSRTSFEVLISGENLVYIRLRDQPAAEAGSVLAVEGA